MSAPTFDRTDALYDPTEEAIALHLAARAALQAAAEHADEWVGAVNWSQVDEAERAWDREQAEAREASIPPANGVAR